MNLGAAYSHLTTSQLRAMLDAARANHRRQMEETKARWAAEVTALKEAMAQIRSQATAELRAQKNASVVLQRQLDIVYAELAKANTVIVEQEQRLMAHNAVVELEKKLSIARRAAS